MAAQASHQGDTSPMPGQREAAATDAPSELGPVEDQLDREAVMTSWWLRAMSAAYGSDRAGYRAAVGPVLAETRVTDAGSLAP